MQVMETDAALTGRVLASRCQPAAVTASRNTRELKRTLSSTSARPAHSICCFGFSGQLPRCEKGRLNLVHCLNPFPYSDPWRFYCQCASAEAPQGLLCGAKNGTPYPCFVTSTSFAHRHVACYMPACRLKGSIVAEWLRQPYSVLVF